MAVAVQNHNQTTLGNLEEGDMVEFKRGLYSHYGVYVGDGYVVHVTGDINSDHCSHLSEKVSVQKEKFLKVAGNSKAYKTNKDTQREPLPKHEIVTNALSKIGRMGYNLLNNNCEHFANWCRYGIGKSDQVDDYIVKTGVAVLGVLNTVVNGEDDEEK